MAQRASSFTVLGERVSVVLQEPSERAAAPALPLLLGPPTRDMAWRGTQAISAADFLGDVLATARALPVGQAAINLCEDRYAFLVAFCALAVAGQTNLLPPARTPQAVDDILAAHPGAYTLSEVDTRPRPPRLHRIALDPQLRVVGAPVPLLPHDRLVAIGYTSGSTGVPKANPKTWGAFCASSAQNVALLKAQDMQRPLHVLATVPPQHMYGLETSVLLPLLGACAIHAARPLFPADVAQALCDLPEPRLLVTTPVHLRALVQAGTELPPLAGILSATAPLTADLAAAAEARFGTTVTEVFGSTETCVIAHRRAAQDAPWTLYEGVQLRPQPDGTLVEAPHLPAPVPLQDLVELLPQRRFRLCGRNTDLLEIAGKRASLGDLTRRLLALPGVQDGVVFQLDADRAGVRRLAALVVAPQRSEAELLAALRLAIDPAFLPRPLRRVAALPRNETGKLPRAALLGLLGDAG